MNTSDSSPGLLCGAAPAGPAGPAGAQAWAGWREFADALPHIVWLVQADGRPCGANQRWFDYAGGSLQDDTPARDWAEHVHPEDRPHLARLWGPAAGAPHEAELRLRRADGAYRWMLARSAAQPGAAGAANGTGAWLATLTDIDGLKQAAALQEKNLSMHRTVLKVARLGGWTIELPGRVLHWSEENCRLHDVPPGYRPTLQEGISYFLPEHRLLVERHVQECLAHGTPYEFVLPKRTATGRRIWVRSVGEAVRDASGQIVRIQGAFQDITEQKDAQAHALDLEAQLTTTLESITDGFCLLDQNWKYVYLNGPAERMTRRSRKDLLGRSLWEAFPGVAGTRMERECWQAVQERRTAHFEDFYPPLGVWFDIHLYPVANGLAIYFQDVTQRHAEQAQLALLQTAVSRINDMVVITQAQGPGGEGARIVFVNDAFERQTGHSRESAIGNGPGFLWGPRTDRAELRRIQAAVEKFQAVRAEIVVYTKAGQPRWLETDIAPIADAAGRFTHWVAVERDITERREQQQEILRLNSDLEARVLLRTAQLAAANKELESFAYSVSHDLRAPLGTLHGFSQLLLRLDGPQMSAKGRHYLARMGAAAKQMGELIEGLLSLARLSSLDLRTEPVDLSALARRIGRECREREPGRQVQLHVQDGLEAHGDARLLWAVLHNLLGNAWKFTARRALARIEVGRQAVAAGRAGEENGADAAGGASGAGSPVFFVRDNGAGFDPAFAHKLFGTFERLHSPEDFPGTGIGLATVRRIVERHGGHVWAESRPGQGAAFFFTLGAPGLRSPSGPRRSPSAPGS